MWPFKSYDGSTVPKAYILTEPVLREARLWCELRGTDYCSHLNVEHNEQNTSDINYAACGAFQQKYFRNLQYRPVMFLLTPNTWFNYFWPNYVQVETQTSALCRNCQNCQNSKENTISINCEVKKFIQRLSNMYKLLYCKMSEPLRIGED